MTSSTSVMPTYDRIVLSIAGQPRALEEHFQDAIRRNLGRTQRPGGDAGREFRRDGREHFDGAAARKAAQLPVDHPEEHAALRYLRVPLDDDRIAATRGRRDARRAAASGQRFDEMWQGFG